MTYYFLCTQYGCSCRSERTQQKMQTNCKQMVKLTQNKYIHSTGSGSDLALETVIFCGLLGSKPTVKSYFECCKTKYRKGKIQRIWLKQKALHLEWHLVKSIEFLFTLLDITNPYVPENDSFSVQHCSMETVGRDIKVNRTFNFFQSLQDLQALGNYN